MVCKCKTSKFDAVCLHMRQVFDLTVVKFTNMNV